LTRKLGDQLSKRTVADQTTTSTHLISLIDFYRHTMEFGPLMLAGVTLLSSIAMSIINIKESALIYSDLSSAKNSFECGENASHILLGQKASTIDFAASNAPCLFPNTYDQGQRHQSYSFKLFQDVLSQVTEDDHH
jgi:hypothetical protein